MSVRDRRVNFLLCLIDAVGFPLGFVFFSFGTILPTFLGKCGAGDATIGALMAVNALVVFLPGLFVVPTLRRLSRVKHWVLLVGAVERIALLLLAPLALLWGRSHPNWLIVATFVAVAIHSISMGFNMPAYWMLVGKVIDARWRGRLYGIAGGVAGVLGIGTEAVLRRYVLSGSNGGFPEGYARGFWIGFVLMTVSMLPFLWVREPAGHGSESEEVATSGIASRRALRDLWDSDAGMRILILGQGTFCLSGMATPFLVLHAQRNLGADAADVSLYTAAGVFAAAFGSLVAGWLADRIGNLTVLLSGMGLGALGLGLALALRSPGAYTGVFVVSTIALATIGITSSNLIMERAGDPVRIGYATSFFNLATALPRAAAPLAGGLLAGAAGYPAVFAVCFALAIVGTLLTLPLRRAHAAR
ncbi:MAG: MFS transporter [Armatimonadota bacterium]